jgi:RNA polymerase sigma-70 factor (ECF subfamily)
LFRLVGDRDDAADLTQEAFLNAFRALESFRREASEYTWLARIAVNAAKNRFRSRDRRRQVEADGGDLSAGAEQIADTRPDGSPPAALEARELGEAIDAAIAGLPDELRMVIVLRDIEGCSYKDIADVTGASVENVKTRIFRGRSRIRRVLEPYLSPEGGWE